MGLLAILINAFSRDSLRCALWFLLSICLHNIAFTICLFLFLSFSLSLLFSFFHLSPPPLCPFALFLSDFLFIRPCIYLFVCLCSAHVLSVCVYVRRAALNNMHYGREWMELYNKVVKIWTWESRMEFWGILRDLPESGLNRRDLKRVTFVFTPASFRESGENIEFMKVSARI